MATIKQKELAQKISDFLEYQHPVQDACTIYEALKYSEKADKHHPDAEALLSLLEKYLSLSPEPAEGRWMVAHRLVEEGYTKDAVTQHLSPWLRLIFQLNAQNTSIDTLQQWLFDAGFKKPISEEAKSTIQGRCASPAEALYGGTEWETIEAIFGDAVCSVSMDSGDAYIISAITEHLLKALTPSIDIQDIEEIWDDTTLANIDAKPVSDNLSASQLKVLAEGYVLTRFNHKNTIYGFYHSDDHYTTMFLMMRNINCFLNHINRKERVFKFEHNEERMEFFILAEPEKMKELGDKLNINIVDADEEACAMKDYVSESLPGSASLCTLTTPPVISDSKARTDSEVTLNHNNQQRRIRKLVIVGILLFLFSIALVVYYKEHRDSSFPTTALTDNDVKQK